MTAPLNNALFHPAAWQWFKETFGQPTPAQAEAWPAIASGENVLVAAPTGSGKTLAAFFSAINDLVQESLERGLPEQTRVLYISPLKALSTDVKKNLQQPLEGINTALSASGLPTAAITAASRTGDTTPNERARMRRKPPHILVTTPESLYILLTSASGRSSLSTVRTVIVDELHALANSKRGAHLTLSLERLSALCAKPPLRIGLSATQKPIDRMANYLVGQSQAMSNGDSQCTNPCRIVDSGHIRDRDLELVVPASPLSAVMEAEVWAEVYAEINALVASHRTTLIFVNNRRLAERAARVLAEKLGDEFVTAHHGSLSKEHRLTAEQKLKAGELKALVATASLELGIDIGDIDLVIQLGSPRSIAAFLQRVGRAGHQVGATPKGRLFPLSRDELVECTALLAAVERGELDAIRFIDQPLDVLSQQIVAETAHQDWNETELFEQLRCAWPYRNLTKETYQQVISMLSEGFSPQRGRRSALIHRDEVASRLRGRKGSGMRAIMNGGTIPDTFDYDVLLQPEGTFIGTLNEDFAFESLPGDVFQLGTNSYRVLQVVSGKVYAAEAPGQAPSIPFWFGDAPGRSDELSASVSKLRADIGEQLATNTQQNVIGWAHETLKLSTSASEQLVEYLGTAQAALGAMPTQQQIVFERFFDGNGDLHFIIHSPFGSRINRAWGLALRKRFCRKFNFELQAAAVDDSIVLSLGATHSFPMEEPARYLNSNTVRTVLTQAVLDSPMFEARWRWAATTAQAVTRSFNGRKAPAQFQRSDAEDLIAVVFPDQIACAENLAGPREVPNHPLVKQTLYDCLLDTMDVLGLEKLLQQLESGAIKLHCAELTTPSPFALEIVNAKPFAFLDDGAAEERRTLAIERSAPLNFDNAADIGKLNPTAIERVKQEAWPQANTANELHDAIVMLGCMTDEELLQGCSENDAIGLGWSHLRRELISQQRIWSFSGTNSSTIWVAAERISEAMALWQPPTSLPAELAAPTSAKEPQIELATEPATDAANTMAGSVERACQEMVRSRLEGLGPVPAATIAQQLQLDIKQIEVALLTLEHEGFVIRGQFSPLALPSTDSLAANEEPAVEWCERRLLARIHRYTRNQKRQQASAVSLAAYSRFLLHWQGITDRGEGTETLAIRLEQLAGWAAPASAWEPELLTARVKHYSPMLLDQLGASGQLTWARFHTAPNSTPETAKNTTNKSSRESPRRSGPIKATPITLLSRNALPGWRALSPLPNLNHIELSSGASRLHEILTANGPQFFADLKTQSGQLPSQLEQSLGELVAWGLISADGFAGLRALLKPAANRAAPSRRRGGSRAGSPRGTRIGFGGMDAGGRWWLMSDTSCDQNEALLQLCWQLLQRYGVVARAIVLREPKLPPWRELLYVYRRLEARDEIRGGRFVEQLSGEQFALPEVASSLVSYSSLGNETNKGNDQKAIVDGPTANEPFANKLVALSACDPANLLHLLNDKAKLANIAGNKVLLKNGVPVALMSGEQLDWLNPESQQSIDQQEALRVLRGHVGHQPNGRTPARRWQ